MSSERLQQISGPDYSTYHSVFEYRYGSSEMRSLWSEEHLWETRRKVWLAVATVQNRYGLVTDEQLADLSSHIADLDIGRIFELERNVTKHDVVAAIREYAEKAPIGGEVLHQGLTSEDVLSNAEIIITKEAIGIIKGKLGSLLNSFADRIEERKNQVCMGWTHIQAAEPTTVGYRLARYAQDFLFDYEDLELLENNLKGKGIKGAVGTSASIKELLDGKDVSPRKIEEEVMAELGLEAVLISGQTYPRKILYRTISVLAGVAQSAKNFATDVMLLQSSAIAEWAEPSGKKQVGSSAMPHKRNPINDENIASLARSLSGNLVEAWMTAADVFLERTLQDSAGKRSFLPESFLAIDEILTRMQKVVKGLEIHDKVIKRNMEQFGPFAALELVLAQAGKYGMDRQLLHEILREHAILAQQSVWRGEQNMLASSVINDQRINLVIPREVLEQCFNKINTHIGDASERAQAMVDKIKDRIKSN